MKRILDIYLRRKKKYGEKLILFFHVGKTYRSYFEDAKLVSRILGIRKIIKVSRKAHMVLTMACVPEDNMEEYRDKILDLGYGVYTCDARDAKCDFILR